MQSNFTGEIEIDESLFGRRIKHHRGNPKSGLKIWVFGMVERSSNTMIMYPVNDRSRSTLLPIIKRHVEPGSTIYSDGWSAYCDLNSEGYRHFTVLHKYTFKSFYRNVGTGEIQEVHINRVKGAWRHAKTHFKKISGTLLPLFEGHLAKVMWRSEVKGNVYVPFFDLLKTVYHLNGAPTYTYSTPLFDSWDVASVHDDVWEVIPEISDAGDEEEVPSQPDHTPKPPVPAASQGSEIVISSGDSSIACAQAPDWRHQEAGPSTETTSLLKQLFSGSESDDPIQLQPETKGKG